DPRAGGTVTGVESALRNIISGKAVERAIAIAQIDVVRIRLRGRRLVAVLDAVETVSLWNVQGGQDQRVQNTEYYRVCADGHSQRDDGDDGETGRLPQHPEGEAHVPQEIIEEHQPPFSAIVFFHGFDSAELEHGLATRFHRREPGANILFRLHGDV